MAQVELPDSGQVIEDRRRDPRRAEDRRDRLTTAQPLFWVVVGSVVVLFLFFMALDTFDPGDAPAATVVVAVLALLWLAHSWRRSGGATSSTAPTASGADSDR